MSDLVEAAELLRLLVIKMKASTADGSSWKLQIGLSDPEMDRLVVWVDADASKPKPTKGAGRPPHSRQAKGPQRASLFRADHVALHKPSLEIGAPTFNSLLPFCPIRASNAPYSTELQSTAPPGASITPPVFIIYPCKIKYMPCKRYFLSRLLFQIWVDIGLMPHVPANDNQPLLDFGCQRGRQPSNPSTFHSRW
jgi:hypothetical protein